MAYTPVSWEDYPSVNTPVSASNLNHMDTQIKANADDIEDIKGDITTLNNNLANCWKVAKMNVDFSDVTFPAGSLNQSSVFANIPEVNNFTILNARSTASGRQLFPMNAYVSSGKVYVPIYNLWSSDYTNVSGTIEITYAYI